MQQPRQRNSGRLLAELSAQRFPLLELRANLGDALECLRRLASGGVFVAQHAAQQATRQWTPWDDSDAVFDTCRQHFKFDRAHQQVVVTLLADEAEESAATRSFVRSGNVPTSEVAAAYVDDLALLGERLHRLPDFVPRRGAIHVVHLEEIDVIGLQATQAGVARGANVSGRQATVVRPIGHWSVQLGGKYNLVAPIAAEREPVANDFFGGANAEVSAVTIGGVEEVDAQLERSIHDGVRVGLRGLGSEVHRAEAQFADL